MVDQSRVKKTKKLIGILLATAGLIALGMSFFVKDKESKGFLVNLGIGFLTGMLIAGFFKSRFGNKPTREEIEESQKASGDKDRN